MLDDLRDHADTTFFEEEEDEVPATSPKSARSSGYFLGMSPAQRFVIAVMLLGLSCLLSTLCLLVTGKVALPFLF